MTMNTVLDAVSPAEAFQLIGEGAQLLTGLNESADTFFPDLDRLRHIMTELGDDASADTSPAAYLQSVIDGAVDMADPGVADELGKIHAAHGEDAVILALFKSAVQAYADFALARADAALAKE